MDAEGFLWNCRYGGGCVVRVAPNGAIDRVVEMPTPNVTTCTFGGDDLRTLYITTAAAGAKPGDRFAGGLFTLKRRRRASRKIGFSSASRGVSLTCQPRPQIGELGQLQLFGAQTSFGHAVDRRAVKRAKIVAQSFAFVGETTAYKFEKRRQDRA